MAHHPEPGARAPVLPLPHGAPDVENTHHGVLRRLGRSFQLSLAVLAMVATVAAVAVIEAQAHEGVARGRVAQESLARERIARGRLVLRLAVASMLLGLTGLAIALFWLRRRAREAAREFAAFLEAALASAPLGFAILDREARFLHVNDALAAIDGVAPREHAGRRLEDVAPTLAGVIGAPVRRVLETEEPWNGEEISVGGLAPGEDARERRLLCTCYPVRSGDGVVLAAGLVITDVTEHRHIEAKLAQAERMEAVGRLAGGVAHDFNNILTVVQTHCELLLMSFEGTDERREDVAEITEAAKRAAALTRQLLAVSRAQALHARPISLNDVVRSVEEVVRRLASEAIAIDIRLAPDLVWVFADARQMEQVVLNLAVNAADAMPNGGRLTIETANVSIEAEEQEPDAPPPGVYATLVVRDSGAGMDDASLARIFEPFFTTRPAARGTGLGLSTVYGIVSQSNGRIRVSSEVGSGTTFTIYLPRRDEAADEEGRRESVPATSGRAAPPGTGITVLLVEDEAPVRAAVRRLLEHRGYTVLAASGGAEALRLSAEYPGRIDLVLSDVRMPGMNGHELVDRLRAGRPEVRVLLMSGYTGDRAERHDEGATPAGFIEKPFTDHALARAVEEALGR